MSKALQVLYSILVFKSKNIFMYSSICISIFLVSVVVHAQLVSLHNTSLYYTQVNYYASPQTDVPKLQPPNRCAKTPAPKPPC